MESEPLGGRPIFLKMLLEDAPFFSMKLTYVGEKLSQVLIDGQDKKPQEENGEC